MLQKRGYYEKYKHILPLLGYGIIYLTWFRLLEQRKVHYQVIEMGIDRKIPFVEVFIVPYLLWFLYMAVVIGYLFLKDKENYYRSCLFLFTGMTIFLIISTISPNGHHLRPLTMPRDNIFTDLISALYRTDTSTNLWPSIHVYNSIGSHLAISKCPRLKNRRIVQGMSLVLCISIILSTMLIKQHSVFDVITAFILATIMYIVTYQWDVLYATKKAPRML